MSAMTVLRTCLLPTLLLAMPGATLAQEAMHGGMDHVLANHAPAHDHARQNAAAAAPPTPMPMTGTMPMPPSGAHDHGAMHAHAGAAPAGVRSADYSDGLAGPPAMAHAQPLLAKVMLDWLEATHANGGAGQAWEAQAWFGTPLDKLWLRSEGERERGRAASGDVEALWSHATGAFWDVQLGVRHDFGGVRRNWLAFGVQGLAPYWFELTATGYLGAAGRTALRVRASQDWRITQRLILEPELEINLYARHDRRAHADGSAASLGLRLRHEFDPKFAPYVGVAWDHRFGPGVTGDAAGVQWVAGLRAWF